ncbi:putative ATP-dependent RNA helicase dhr2 [Blyttiomyces sp. JEL0837]|nr:putative ATP-dependent RNA helicase dhr2 [Blyttiomyces sp. JEL0837]
MNDNQQQQQQRDFKQELKSLASLASTCQGCTKSQSEFSSKFKVCSACRSVSYCSSQCQKQHWRTHKALCKEFQQQKEKLEALDEAGESFQRQFKLWRKTATAYITNLAIAALPADVTNDHDEFLVIFLNFNENSQRFEIHEAPVLKLANMEEPMRTQIAAAKASVDVKMAEQEQGCPIFQTVVPVVCKNTMAMMPICAPGDSRKPSRMTVNAALEKFDHIPGMHLGEPTERDSSKVGVSVKALFRSLMQAPAFVEWAAGALQVHTPKPLLKTHCLLLTIKWGYTLGAVADFVDYEVLPFAKLLNKIKKFADAPCPMNGEEITYRDFVTGNYKPATSPFSEYSQYNKVLPIIVRAENDDCFLFAQPTWYPVMPNIPNSPVKAWQDRARSAFKEVRQTVKSSTRAECQKAHWPEHKSRCKEFQQQKVAMAAAPFGQAFQDHFTMWRKIAKVYLGALAVSSLSSDGRSDFEEILVVTLVYNQNTRKFHIAKAVVVNASDLDARSQEAIAKTKASMPNAKVNADGSPVDNWETIDVLAKFDDIPPMHLGPRTESELATMRTTLKARISSLMGAEMSEWASRSLQIYTKKSSHKTHCLLMCIKWGNSLGQIEDLIKYEALPHGKVLQKLGRMAETPCEIRGQMRTLKEFVMGTYTAPDVTLLPITIMAENDQYFIFAQPFLFSIMPNQPEESEKSSQLRARTAFEKLRNMVKAVPSNHKSEDHQHGKGNEWKSLPVTAARSSLLKEIAASQTLIVVGETGSGKTTQIPKFLLEAGIAKKGIIAVTQPRRVAATSIARRVCQEMSVKIGEKVGYSVRFDDCTMTDGILLRELLSDKLLQKYSVIILDEAHERTLRTDVLFGMVKSIQKVRSDLKVIVMSATLDAERFAEYFNQTNIMKIPGRQFAVKVFNAEEKQEDYVDAALVATFQVHVDEPPGDILVFLTGQEEIEAVEKMLKDHEWELPQESLKMHICPLFASLPPAQQAKVFAPTPPGFRKIVLATNVAETSITISGIRYVIDTGMVKVRAFNPKLGIESLSITPISKASARQRMGRAGREAPGVCYRLYTEEGFDSLEENTQPEILRCNLANVILTLKAAGVEDVVKFDFLDPPPRNSSTTFLTPLVNAVVNKFLVIRALEHLYALKALGTDGHITPHGRKMAEFPVDPSLATVLIHSKVSFDIVMFDKREEAAEAKRKFVNYEGDHLTLLNVMKGYQSVSGDLDWCTENFISRRAIRNALEIRSQLVDFCKGLGVDYQSSNESEVEPILQSFLHGFFQNVAVLQQDGSYKTFTTKQVCHIHPSSVLFGKKLPLIMYHELVQTSRQYMRNVSAIATPWLQKAGGHYFSIQS